jgi:hypothetical protein
MRSNFSYYSCIRALAPILALWATNVAAVECRHLVNTVENAPVSTPAAHFTVISPLLVRHETTGLTWMRCPVGQIWSNITERCANSAETFTWRGAMNYAQEANSEVFEGHADWRVPNIKELASIAESSCHNPSVNDAVFSGSAAGDTWTSSVVAGQDSRAWAIHFSQGANRAELKDQLKQLRLVRGGL